MPNPENENSTSTSQNYQENGKKEEKLVNAGGIWNRVAKETKNKFMTLSLKITPELQAEIQKAIAEDTTGYPKVNMVIFSNIYKENTEKDKNKPDHNLFFTPTVQQAFIQPQTVVQAQVPVANDIPF